MCRFGLCSNPDGPRSSRLVIALCTVALLQAVAFAKVDVAVLSETQVIRNPGKPEVVELRFPGVPGQPGILRLRNGDTTGALPTASVEVLLNGVTIVAQSDLNMQVTTVERTVTLGAENQMHVRMTSAPTSTVAIQVVQSLDVDAAKVIGIQGGTLHVDDPQSPLNGVSIVIPPNAFQTATVLRIRSAPDFNIPFRDTVEEGIQFGAMEILPEVVMPTPAEIHYKIADLDGDGVLDGTSFRANSGSVYYQEGGSQEARRTSASYDSEMKELVVATRHFSKWVVSYRRWKPGAQVKYYVESLPSSSPDEARTQLADAAAQWVGALDGVISVAETADRSQADFIVRARDFCAAPLLDCNAAAVINRTLDRVTILPPMALEFNTAFDWYVAPYLPYPYSGVPAGQPFKRVALHEMGHIIGLPEYTNQRTGQPCNSSTETNPNVMYYECSGNPKPFVVLGSIDIAEARKHYGLKDALLSEDFDDGVADDWQPLRPGWVVDNRIYKSTNTQCCIAVETYYTKGDLWRDYTVSVQFAMFGTYAPADAQLAFRYKPPATVTYGQYGNYGACQVVRDYGGTRLQAMDTKVAAQYGLGGQYVPVNIVQGQWYTLVAQVRGNEITCEIKEIGGARVGPVTGPFNTAGTISLRGTHTPVWFDNLKVTSK